MGTTSLKTPMIAIVGISNSGKTTLVEKLVSKFKGLGLRVGTIKHSRHQHQIDVPGKDSWRHKNSGAERTLFIGPQTMQLVADMTDAPSPDSLAERYLGDLDIILMEGFMSSRIEKIEVVRSERSRRPITARADGLLALATDIESPELTDIGVPVLRLDDHDAIGDFILKHFSIRP